MLSCSSPLFVRAALGAGRMRWIASEEAPSLGRGLCGFSRIVVLSARCAHIARVKPIACHPTRELVASCYHQEFV